MLVLPHEHIVRACALILKPNHEFKEWVKTAVFKDHYIPTSFDQLMTDEVLYNHSVAFVTPIFHGNEELGDFIDKHHQHIFHSMLLAWPFSLEAWQQNTRKQNLGELFDTSYYFYLVNLFNYQHEDIKEPACTVTILKPKIPCLMWIHQSDIDEIEDLELDLQRRFGVAFLTPSFKSPEEEMHFMQANCHEIWEAGLACYCEDRNLWPHERTYEKLQDWFECVTCYSVVDLTRVRLKNKAA